MKLVVLPGVGYHKDKTTYSDFSNYLARELKCDSEVFYWIHDWPAPTITLPYESIRGWIYEVILDFQQVVLHAFDMEIPKADYYIGHSAGSILALAQKEKSCVIFGSPAVLVEAIHKSTNEESSFNAKMLEAINSKRNILNIVNKYDQLAYYVDLPNVTNYVYQGSIFNPNTYNPIEAHHGYWESKDTRKKIVESIKQWESEKNI